MTTRAPLLPSLVKVLVITGAWTLVFGLIYLSMYLLIVDLIDLGKLSGEYAFWPDFAGNLVVGVFAGLVGGTLLVFKVNAGYKHETFLSSIAHSVVLFLVVFLGTTALVFFSLPFAADALRLDPQAGVERGLQNIRANLQTPSFLISTVMFGLIVSGTQFMLQVNDKFGPGVMWKLMTGRYYHPRQEERVFMFLDLRSSTAIAERIGHERFFELLRELFQDVTRPIVDSRGDIYQYVGDEVVITWPVERGLQDANCIECFFRIRRALEAKGPSYLERFGIAPEFKAGVHVGEATVGEIGVLKKDIVYSGDVLNTTSRIQEECGRRGESLLASSELLGRLSLTDGCVVVPIGAIRLEGKADALALSAVRGGGERALSA